MASLAASCATCASGQHLKSELFAATRASSSGEISGLRAPVRRVAPNSSRSARSMAVRNVASEPKLSTESAPADPSDVVSIASSIKYHQTYTPVFSPDAAKAGDIRATYYATAQSIRDTLVQRWNETNEHFKKTNPKEVAYLSMEFLQGRALQNALGNLGATGAYAEALEKLGVALEDVIESEPNAALGNGGLGRLASCFLDSIATLNLPGWGYGLRYKYGLFKQAITDEGQIESAENWLETGYPWELPRYDIAYPVRFFGEVIDGPNGKEWVGGSVLRAVAYDNPIPGYKTKNTISLRLWNAEVLASDFDLAAFNAGEHERAAAAQADATKIVSVLYPGDGTTEGKLLRLKQQYLLCSASVQDILAQFEERNGPKWTELATKSAIQMNDTHPTLAAPELIRILIDEKGLTWEEAWKVTTGVVAYTNHTVLPEALEKWSQDLIKKLLPRHFEIIEKIDDKFIHELVAKYKSLPPKELLLKINNTRILEGAPLPADLASIFEEKKDPKVEKKVEKKEVALKPLGTVRMANLCVIVGHAVNGVAAIHSEIVKDDVFNDFYQLWPEKFQNKTNGVTPRRWIAFCNPALSSVITKWLGNEDWILHADKLLGLVQYADNEEFQKEFAAAKMQNKIKLAEWVKEKTGYVISPNSLFDIQVKRIHEYKRQLLNILGIVYRYKKMKELSPEERKANYAPRVCIFGGKAFATYVQAKRIVRFIVDVGKTVNNDPDIGDLLKVVFVPDYNVSVAEILIPASELSEHISTAGMEASGTSNMKFAMNGCLLIGTLDGANVEIRDAVGPENFFLFGAEAEEINGLRKQRAEGKFVPDPRFEEVKEYIRTGVFGSYNYDEMIGSLEGNEGYGRADYFLVGYDFPSYIEAQDEVDVAYRDQKRWIKSAILNTANSGFFSSDRTIDQYANEIWDIKPDPAP